MDRYLTLFIAHILADFPLQAGVIYEWKTRSKTGLAIHTAIHLIVVFLLFKPPYTWWPALVTLGVLHFFIDWAKLKFPIRPQLLGFIADQVWHALSLIPLALFFTEMEPAIPVEFLPADFIICMAAPILLMFWTYTWDMKSSEPGSQRESVVKWAQKRLLPISQIVGFFSVGIIAFQILMN